MPDWQGMPEVPDLHACGCRTSQGRIVANLGTASVDALVAQLSSKEDANFRLFGYVAEVNAQAEELLQAGRELQASARRAGHLASCAGFSITKEGRMHWTTRRTCTPPHTGHAPGMRHRGTDLGWGMQGSHCHLAWGWTADPAVHAGNEHSGDVAVLSGRGGQPGGGRSSEGSEVRAAAAGERALAATGLYRHM